MTYMGKLGATQLDEAEISIRDDTVGQYKNHTSMSTL